MYSTEVSPVRVSKRPYVYVIAPVQEIIEEIIGQGQQVGDSPRSSLGAMHENTLVMCSSLSGDEDQGAEVATAECARGRRAPCVPDATVWDGRWRSSTGKANSP